VLSIVCLSVLSLALIVFATGRVLGA